jgi:LysM repeat protein
MKYLFSIVVFLFCLHCFSQTNFIKHKVSKGETVTQIAKEYQVSTAEIYKYNPEAQNALSVDSVLMIPTKNSQFVGGNADSFFEYEVKNQETLYGISKKWGVSIDLIEKSNPNIALAGGLKVGDVLKIPTSKHTVVSDSFKFKSDTLFILLKQKKHLLALQNNMEFQ